MLFQGISSVTIDAKGRLSVPTRHRDAIANQFEGRLTITRHPDGCLMIFPRPEWERYREKVLALPESVRWWKRILVGNAMDVEMDGAGRLLVPPELRQAVGLSKEAVLLGLGNVFELWDKASYEAKEAETLQQQAMPDAIKDITL
ncbi:cell division/cell wall cluster transcriptional repressor MraZ [Vandammella animalimorsus]|uniref:Transcriptional regulator MraZ n=1 Tax=Vandammella animalimorsus TaxID=2029117 RepID=A0A2A2AHX7_9BURK|nr:division/cell wall cluster transcriptional repressor MraZ [Vandammella animalimorsus]MDO4723391.1 division/cell wall cluster transcriptional repressor MraZ [Comamonadaceae bacterium]RRD65751.1 transcriptional regulator MraZ [Comamonadaceae bacterium OH2310_COT-174]PAT32014.1 cell division/cell wall cluster transcriptional repressor MraZ [Vandammella animalimorsus]PAT37387.1 cell division/cell wall cluster transcriptional repressor MraZ [Vandammella animalimorsus]PAT43856.1 cell division/cel